jgi:hypothetical protein
MFRWLNFQYCTQTRAPSRGDDSFGYGWHIFNDYFSKIHTSFPKAFFEILNKY